MFVTLFKKCVILASIFLLYTFSSNVTLPNPAKSNRHTPGKGDTRCSLYPDPENIAVAVKTNSEYISYNALTRLADIFHCLAPERLIILSDVDSNVGPFKLHNVVSKADQSLLHWRTDPNSYRAGQLYERRLDATGAGRKELKNQDILERLELIHMIEKTWQLQPNLDWYVFADVSNYYVWPNLLRWLREIDPRQAHFFGKGTRIENSNLDIPYAEAGFILSGAAIKELLKAGEDAAKAWNDKIPELDNGQQVLAVAVHSEIALKMTDAWPLLIGEFTGRIPFKQEIWCEPVVGLTAVPDAMVTQMLEAEHRRLNADSGDVFTFKDLFEEMSPVMTPGSTRTFQGSETVYLFGEKWDNVADSTQYDGEHIDWDSKNLRDDPSHFINRLEDPNASVSACARACDAFAHCVQFSYMSFDAVMVDTERKVKEGGVCNLSRIYRFGIEQNVNAWVDDGGDRKNSHKSVANTQVLVSAWNRARWEKYTSRLVCQ